MKPRRATADLSGAGQYSPAPSHLSRRDVAIIAAVVLVGAAIYLISSARIYRIGFPLDDSWIHLTYARNLALLGQWAFQPGHPSAGSTAPLWTFLLAIGFWLGLGPYVWTYALGVLTLIGLALMAESAMRRLLPGYQPRLPWAGLFFGAEWHLQWAALSGMETLLHAALIMAVLILILTGSRRYLLMGALTGLSIWVRPDGLTLAGPALLTTLVVERAWSARVRGAALYLAGLAALFVPYLLFNWRLSGTPMPNTFYAKQAEYAAWQAEPLLYRLGLMLVQLLTGPAVILFPGMIGAVVLAVRRRNWPMIAAVLWCGGYLILYTLRLPVYQHGRYLMPAMPALFFLGMWALLEFRGSAFLGQYHRIVQMVAQYSLALITLGFVVMGARSYGDDVGLIESEMVVTAKWVAAHLPANAVIAAHDIGALGYYDHHPLIDLAGLVSPEVIPFIRDEAKIAAFLDRRGANYLVAFPAFYPVLTRASEPVFTSEGPFAPEIGEKNMTVYVWKKP